MKELRLFWAALLVNEFNKSEMELSVVDIIPIDRDFCFTFYALDGICRLYQRNGLVLTFIEFNQEDSDTITTVADYDL